MRLAKLREKISCVSRRESAGFGRMDAAILEKEALLLPDRERAVLVDRLLESLSRSSSELEAAWIQEADRRLEAFGKGRIRAVSGREAMSELRARFPR